MISQTWEPRFNFIGNFGANSSPFMDSVSQSWQKILQFIAMSLAL